MNKTNRTIISATLCTAAFIVLSLVGSFAQAKVITWNLEGVTFDDGRRAIGSFTWDATRASGAEVIDWDIQAGSDRYSSDGGLCGDGIIVPICSAFTAPDELTLVLGPRTLTYPKFLALIFSRPLSDAGGSVSLDLIHSGVGRPPFGLSPGSIVAGGVVAVPEPSTMVFLSFLGGLLLFSKSRARRPFVTAANCVARNYGPR